MRRKLILAATISTLIMFSTAAWAEEGNTSLGTDPVLAALKDVVVNSSNMTSYRLTIDMDQIMTLTNLTNQSEAPQIILVKSFGSGSLNQTEMALKMALASVVTPVGDDENVTATAIEEYFVNDTVYMKIDGNWTKFALSLPNGWSSQDTAAEQIEMLNQSQISLLGIETVDGMKCYKIGIVQDMDAFSRLTSQQDDLLLGTINLSELYQNATMDLIYWIDMDQNLLRKMELTMDMSINLQDLGIPAEETGDKQVQMLLHTIYMYRDINENIQIVLPPEAAAAQPLGLGLFNQTTEEMPQNSTDIDLSAVNQSTINNNLSDLNVSTINQSMSA
jgi:hypothetical protein